MTIIHEVMSSSALPKSLERWGTQAQANMAIEECSELITALRHFDRGKVTLDDLQTEIADVIIIALEMRLVFGEAGVDKHIAYKLHRLEHRLRIDQFNAELVQQDSPDGQEE